MKNILRSGLSLSCGNLLVHLANLGRDTSIAIAFGTGIMVDSFFLALMFPIFLMTVGLGAFRNTIVPLIEKVKHLEGAEKAKKVISRILVTSIPIVLATGTLLAALAPFLAPAISGNLPDPTSSTIKMLIWAALPMFLLAGYANLCEGPLQTQGSFFAPSLLRAGLPLGICFGSLFLSTHYGIFGAFYGGFLGAGFQLLLMYILCLRENLLSHVWTPLNPLISQEVRKQFIFLSSGVAITYLSPLIDQWMASFLEVSSVSYLNYGNRLVVGVTSISIGALGPVILPHFSKIIAQQDTQLLNKHYIMLVRAAWWTGIALAGILWIVSEPLVVLLYEHGHFLRTESLAVSSLIAWLSLQIPALLVGIIASTLISAASQNSVFPKLSLLMAVVNASGNFILMQWYGLSGIALATGLTYIVSAITMNIILRNRLGIVFPRKLLIDFLISLSLAALIAWGLVTLNAKPSAIPTWAQFLGSTLSLSIYVIVACLFNYQTVINILNSIYKNKES